MDGAQGLLVVEELLPVEGVVFLLGDILFGPLPDGHHGVQGLGFGVGLIIGLGFAVFIHRIHSPGLGNLHADGVADIVGILADKIAQAVFFQELGVVFLLGIGLDGHDDVGAGGCLVPGFNGVAVSAVADPFPGLVLAVLFGDNGDGGGNHEGGVEAHAELADDVHILLLFHGLLEGQAAGLGDDTQVLLHVLPGHADAVIGNHQDPAALVPGDGDGELIPGNANLVIGQGGVGQLVDGIGGVGNDLPEEDLPVGVNRIDHQVQKTLRFGFELHFFHDGYFLSN